MNNVFVYDLEVFPNLFSAGFKTVNGSEYHLFVLDEKRNDIQKLIDWIESFDGELTLIGHNILGYDNIILNAIFAYPENVNNASLKRLNDKIIQERDTFRLTDLYKELTWQAPKRWISYDTMEITRVNQMRISLKFAGVLLKLKNIEDLPYHPDTVLTEEQRDHVINYMVNDIDTNIELWLAIQPEIQTRYDVEAIYGIDVHSRDRTGVGKEILNTIYTQETGKTVKELLDSVPEPPMYIHLSDCISSDIRFDTDEMQIIRDRVANTTVYNSIDYRYGFTFPYHNTNYKIGIGGLHSVDGPGKFKTTEDVIIRDADVSSFYPNILIVNKFRPPHLGENFTKILASITKERLEAKKNKKDPHTKKMAESLKITINAIYGLMGNKYYWLYSPQTLLSVTISGQLYLLDLIEKLHLAGIETISANTDGVTCKIPPELESKYYEVCNEWQTRTQMELEYANYLLYARKDVNNYITIKDGDDPLEERIKTKGCFVPGKWDGKRWMQSLNKGFNTPITAIALYKYYAYDIPIEDTVYSHNDIYDYMVSKRVDTNKYQPTLWVVENGKVIGKELQKTNRFLVTLSGGSFEKSSLREGLNSTSIAAGQRVTITNRVISENVKDYDLNYEWYIKETRKTLDLIEPREIALF